MTISLPYELESSLRGEVLSGHFASEAEAVAAIVRDYFRRKAVVPASTPGVPGANGGMGMIGALRDDADLLDQAVGHAMKAGEERPLTEAEFKQQLLKSGFMASLPTPPDQGTRRAFQPVTLDGEPLSETIIRERR